MFSSSVAPAPSITLNPKVLAVFGHVSYPTPTVGCDVHTASDGGWP